MPRVNQARDGQVNYGLFDQYTLAHALFGLAMGLYGTKATTALMTAMAWEVGEPFLKERVPVVFPYTSIDSSENKFGDVVGWMAGWILGDWYKRTR
jgi:hypothetical protein